MAARKVLIVTGVFPPDVGGPAKYALNLSRIFKEKGCEVVVIAYGQRERLLPLGFRHLFFFLRLCKAMRGIHYVLALDTVSVGIPAFWAAMLTNKPFLVRIGGDFLWESYVERTRSKILLSQFYEAERNFSLKERIIFSLSAHMLRNADRLVFTTAWLKEIFESAYPFSQDRTCVIENFSGGVKEISTPVSETQKVFLSSSRPIFLKNQETLLKVFQEVQKENSMLELVSDPLPGSHFSDVLKSCYAVVVPSLSEVSPNLVLEALSFQKPVIVTEDCGIKERIAEVALFVDPLSDESLKDAIRRMGDEEFYKKQKEKIAQWNYIHSWENIGDEFLRAFSEVSHNHQ